MTQFDLIALFIILVSAAIGFVRGATRELVTALSFILAAALSLLLVRVTGPIARPLIDPDWVAVLVAILVTFVILYVALRLLGGRLSHGILETQAFGTVDRTVGVGIGLLRAMVVLGAFAPRRPRNQQGNRDAAGHARETPDQALAHQCATVANLNASF